MSTFWPREEELHRVPTPVELEIRAADCAIRAAIRAEPKAAGEADPWDFSDVFEPYLPRGRKRRKGQR